MAPQYKPTEIDSVRFDSLEELDSWADSHDQDVLDKFRLSRELYSNYRRTKPSSNLANEPKVVVCHDYKGNYLNDEDNSPIGYFPHKDGFHYFLQFPSLVDVFIYFSHTKISVPPVSWTNALHKQGILSLGTVIFEGVHQQTQLESFIERTNDGKFKYVEYLVLLAKHYGFDGWLINIETYFPKHIDAPEIVKFVESLKAEFHVFNPDSKIIWYDSYISKINRIAYQNGVNEYNYDHFESSDLFFTNYWWDENTLRDNVLNVGLQGIRKKVFVGIDVWGRGSKIGSGGFESGLAMKFIKLYSSNIGLFAPAWTYEHFNKEDFIMNDQQFWIEGITNSNRNGSVSTYVEHYLTPVYINDSQVVFYTNFSQGEGLKYFSNGHKIFDKPWVNVDLQQVTPSYLKLQQLEISKEDAFNGGSSLKVMIQKSVENSSKSNIIKLFDFNNDLISKNLNISVSFKYIDEAVKNDLALSLEITYTIERRYKTISKVREGVYRVPLAISSNWKSLDTTFPLPRLQLREHFVLTGARINWIPNEISESGTHVYNQSNQSWIVVSGYNDINKKYEFLIGDILIEGSDSTTKDINAVTKVKTEELSGDEVISSWADDLSVLHWVIYVNAAFVGTTSTPNWILRRSDRLRIDSFTRFGRTIRGEDVFV